MLIDVTLTEKSMSCLAYCALLTLGDPSTGEVLRGDTALEGRSKMGSFATRRKGSTRLSDLARLILVDGADDELDAGGIGDSVENGKEDCRT